MHDMVTSTYSTVWRPCRNAVRYMTTITEKTYLPTSQKFIATIIVRMDTIIEIERLVSMAASLAVPKSEAADDIRANPFHLNEAFSPVLDSIAVLCVRKTKKEAFACGIQVDDTTSNIRLTLAANTAVPRHAVDHIQDLWERLKRLSEMHKQDDLEQQTIPEQRSDFREAVFTYSVKRQIHVFYKHFDALLSFSKEVEQLRDNSELSSRTDFAQWSMYFDGCLHVMIMFSEIFVRDQPPTSWNARKMGVIMEVLRVFVAHLLMNKSICDYVSQPTDSRTRHFPLKEHLRSLVVLPRSVRTLTEFASRQRNSLYFGYKLDIKTILVNSNPEYFSVPISWEDFINSQFPRKRPVPLKIMQEIHDAFSGRSDAKQQPHCESVLAAYFYSLTTRSATPWSYITPLEYLGTSKVSCAACLIYLDALRTLPSAPPLYSNGSRSKWCRFWSYPMIILDKRLVETVYQKTHKEVSWRLGIVLQKHNQMSEPPAPEPFDPIMNPEVLAMLARIRVQRD